MLFDWLIEVVTQSWSWRWCFLALVHIIFVATYSWYFVTAKTAQVITAYFVYHSGSILSVESNQNVESKTKNVESKTKNVESKIVFLLQEISCFDP